MLTSAKGCARKTVILAGSILIPGDQVFRNFEQKLQSVARGGGTEDIVIDFSGCFYVDSRAVSVIISVNRRLRISGRCLRMINAGSEIRELFHAIQLDRILEIV